jgi:hypothetical protein
VRLALSEACTYIDESGEYQDKLVDALMRGIAAGEPSVIKLVAAYRWGTPIARIELAGQDGGPVRVDLLSDAQLVGIITGGKTTG